MIIIKLYKSLIAFFFKMYLWQPVGIYIVMLNQKKLDFTKNRVQIAICVKAGIAFLILCQ